jgi:hypothetical protein
MEDTSSNDAAVSDAIHSMLSSEDIQRILNAFSDENAFNIPFLGAQDDRSLANSTGMPFDSSMIPRDEQNRSPLSKQIQGVTNDTDHLNARVNGVNSDLDSIIENLRFSPQLVQSNLPTDFAQPYTNPMPGNNLGEPSDFDFDTFLDPPVDQYPTSISDLDPANPNLQYPVTPSYPPQQQQQHDFTGGRAATSSLSPENIAPASPPRKKRKAPMSKPDPQGAKKKRK